MAKNYSGEVIIMRMVVGTMIGFYILSFWFFPFIYEIIFPWGGVPETHLHPIYMGIILLSGLIVACTKIILEKIEGKSDNNNDEK